MLNTGLTEIENEAAGLRRPTLYETPFVSPCTK
jgi:hypothetical protein